MKKLLTALVVCFGLTGCMENASYAQSVQPQVQYGCSIIEDNYGEREVCDTNYYVSDYGVIYWDPYFSIWAGNGFYNYNGGWYRGYYPGYYNRYNSYYHVHGFYQGYNHGYYGHHFGGGNYNHGGYSHGGSFGHGNGGSFHGSGGHSGGSHGGHR